MEAEEDYVSIISHCYSGNGADVVPSIFASWDAEEYGKTSNR